MLARDRYVCQIRLDDCLGNATHVDHRVALAEGGTDAPSNLQAACPVCNLIKGATVRHSRVW